MVLVGPYNDHGWSQAHYEGGHYVEEKLPGAKMVYVDKVNPADRPGITVPQLVDELMAKGAKLVFTTSDDMKDGAIRLPPNHPDIPWSTSPVTAPGRRARTTRHPQPEQPHGADGVRQDDGRPAAALTTQTGKIGYLGPLINDETRRLAASAYLGAQYAWDRSAVSKDPADLPFSVNWIGFWFNIPGVTSDPTQVAENFFNQGYDVVRLGHRHHRGPGGGGQAGRRRQAGLGRSPTTS